MNQIKEISIEEYKKLWENMMCSQRLESPRIDPIMREMIVIGQSGKGTPFKNEYERPKHEWLNPKIPVQINIIDEAGTTTYIPKKVR